LAFYGAEVIYDGIPSSLYDLRIMDFETNGDIDSPAGAEMEIFEKYIYRKNKSFYFGRTQNTPLEFDLTLASKNPIDATTRSAIQKLFLGRSTYKDFQVFQDDMMLIKFEVLFTGATNKYIGNVQRGIILHGRCNSPYGMTYPRTFTRSFSGNGLVNYDFSIYNDSDNDDYLYPEIEFTLNTVGNSFQIINYTDDNRTFLFSDLQPEETVTIDNYRQTVVSDTGLLRLSSFNKKWLRLLPGNNVFNVQSGIGTFTITYSEVKSIGA
jgi:hypothetical protein